MSPSAGFCAIWQTDKIHDLLLSYTSREVRETLRLVCKPFAEDIAPLVFNEINIKFNTHTFSRQARMNALDRIGHHVKHVNFAMSHGSNTFLAPLLDPETGEEQTFVYSPEVEINDRNQIQSRSSKFGDWEIAELLIQQYPPIFHSATNISGFVRAFSAMSNMESLTISCPNQASEQRYRRSAVDYALISLRMAIEHVCPPRLRDLNLAPIHSSSVFYLRAFTSLASSPRSTRVWRRIKSLMISIDSHASCPQVPGDLYKILHTYLSTFTSLQNLRFTWLGTAGPMPLSLHAEPSLFISTPPPRPITPPCSPPGAYPPSPTDSPSSSPTITCPPPLFSRQPQAHSRPKKTSIRPLEFPHLQTFHLTNSLVDSASQIASFIQIHRRTLREFSFHDTNLLKGNWDDALAPLSKMSGNDNWKREQERCWSWQPNRSRSATTTSNSSTVNPAPSTPPSPSQHSTTSQSSTSHSTTTTAIEDDNSTSLEVPFLLSTPAAALHLPSLTTTTTTTSTATTTSPSPTTSLQKPLPVLPNELIEGPLWDTLLTNTLNLGYGTACHVGGGGGKRRVLVALGRVLGRVLGGCSNQHVVVGDEAGKDHDADSGGVVEGGGEGGDGGKKVNKKKRRKRKVRKVKKRDEREDEWEEWWMGNWDGLVDEGDVAHDVHEIVT